MKQKLNKAISFKIQKSDQHALLVQHDQGPYFYDKLHYHPEFQITAIIKGEGIFYAGNNMSTYSNKAVFLIGSGTPHLLKNADQYYTKNSPGVESISLFFDHYSFGKQFFDISEMAGLKTLLQSSNRVIKVSGAKQDEIYNKIIAITSKTKEELVIAFLEILSLIKKAKKEFINSAQYQLVLNDDEGGRLNDVLNYTFKHSKTDISLEDITRVAHLSRSQFSKFFKAHTGKTYIQFLNELRIENACVLLGNTNSTIEQICYETGFKNVSNFVRQFKKVKKETPSGYRRGLHFR
nr:transcriptional regulator, AraC family [uncultured bacterium]